MSEGDTIYRVAQTLRGALVGETPRRVTLFGREERSLCRRVLAVRSRGKHLLIDLESGDTIRVHLGMHGSWERRAEDAAGAVRGSPSLALELATETLACHGASAIELIPTARQGASRALARLGPDLLDPDCDLAVVVRRARVLGAPGAPIGDLLLDQRIAAGVGNVFKSEILFLAGVAPSTTAGSLDDETLRELYELARTWLARSARDGMRRTTADRFRGARPGGPKTWVYGRAGRPCLRCGAPVRSARLGRGRRSTYWCPRCQPDPPRAS